MAQTIEILTVDDHPVVREGLAGIINNQPDMRIIDEASNGAEAISLFRKHRPDVTVMDLRLPDMSGTEAIAAIVGEFPDASIVVLTSAEGDVQIQSALKAGAKSYLLKGMPAAEMLDVIRQVHAGKRRIPWDVAAKMAEHLGEGALTPREIQVLQLVALGNRNKEVGAELSITNETVRMHMKNILGKLGAHDRTQAVTIALRRGILQL